MICEFLGVVLKVVNVEHMIRWYALSLSVRNRHCGFFIRLATTFSTTLHIPIALMSLRFVSA